jgi:hypothetical protein
MIAFLLQGCHCIAAAAAVPSTSSSSGGNQNAQLAYSKKPRAVEFEPYKLVSWCQPAL